MLTAIIKTKDLQKVSNWVLNGSKNLPLEKNMTIFYLDRLSKLIKVAIKDLND